MKELKEVNSSQKESGPEFDSGERKSTTSSKLEPMAFESKLMTDKKLRRQLNSLNSSLIENSSARSSFAGTEFANLQNQQMEFGSID